MEFKFNKLFSGASKQKTVVSFEELGRMFSGGSSWNKNNLMKQYSKSLYVFAAVNKIATKVSDIDLNLFQITSKNGDSKEVLNHEALDLMTKINPFQTRTEFLKTAWINKKITGEAFWLKVRNDRGQVVELWNLRPDLMTVVSDPKLYVKQYELQKEGGGKEIFDPSDIIHFKDPDPLNPFRGMSPLIASKSRIETEESATNYQRDFFKNNARPDALLVTEQQLDTDQRTQMVSAWEERHQGVDNEAKIGILEGGMKYQQVSISQREMDYIESMKFTRDDILVALGVPKSVVTSDDISYANAETGLRMFLAETVMPEMSQLVEVLNAFLLVPDFGEQYFFTYDDPTPSDRESRRSDSTAAFGKWMTVNEIRAEYNLPPIEGGDVIAQISSSGESVIYGDSNGKKPKDNKVEENKRRMALKLLQGRPMLRKKFELYDAFKSEMIRSTKKATLAAKAASKTKKKEKDSYISAFSDDEVRQNYYILTNKRIDSRKKTFERALLSEFSEQEDRVLKALDERNQKSKGVYEKLSTTDIRNVMNTDAEKRLFATFALPFLMQYAQEGGEDAAKFTDETFDMTDQLEKAIEARSKFFASSVIDTTFQSLVRTLTEGVNSGEGIDALKNRVRDVYTDIPDWRAALIARTETTNANNEGILEQYRESSIIKGKEWIATMDDVTRDEHAELNGQIRKLDEVFSNGLMYPNEPNCRCVLGPALYGKKSLLKKKGGPGSGNHGHSGRPGHRGGSKPTGGGSAGGALSEERVDEFALNMNKKLPPKLQVSQISGLSEDESIAVHSYVSTREYARLNSNLREGRTSEINDTHAALLNNALDKFDVGPETVYRGIKPKSRFNSQEELDTFVSSNFSVGATYSDKGFMSTSVSKTSATEFRSSFVDKNGSVMLQINNRSGKVLRHNDTDFINEKEVLFKPGSKFKVDSIKVDKYGYVISMTEESQKKLSKKDVKFMKLLTESDTDFVPFLRTKKKK